MCGTAGPSAAGGKESRYEAVVAKDGIPLTALQVGCDDEVFSLITV